MDDKLEKLFTNYDAALNTPEGHRLYKNNGTYYVYLRERKVHVSRNSFEDALTYLLKGLEDSE